jgi:hypothetical protein
MPLSSSPVIERYVTSLHLEDPGLEEPAGTRDRLREFYPRGATRRMTQLGMIIGHTLLPLEPASEDTLVYLSGYGETRALEAYLESFPAASPTLFQTSIHPSAVEQVLIGLQQPVLEFWPMTGDDHLVAQGLLAGLLSPSARVVVCGGEERGTWLLKQSAASERTFAFAFALRREQSPESLARLSATAGASPAPVDSFPLPRFFDHLHERRDFVCQTPAGVRLAWSWL